MLERRITLSKPTAAVADGPFRDQGSYATVRSVWATIAPLTARDAERFGGQVQTGAVSVTVRRPIESAGVEVKPDRTWRATYTDGGATVTLHVSSVMDGTPALPSARLWTLFCTERRGVA